MLLGRRLNASALMPIRANGSRRRLRKYDFGTRTQHRNKVLPTPAAGLAAMRQDFYGLINLAKLLTIRRGTAQKIDVVNASSTRRKTSLTIWQSLIPNIAAGNYLRAHIFNATLFSPATGQALQLAGLCAASPVFAGVVYRRMAAIYSQLTTAVAAVVEQQNSATGEISHNDASAAQGTGHVVAVLGQVAGATTETRASA
jgi:hypothetical protein